VVEVESPAELRQMLMVALVVMEVDRFLAALAPHLPAVWAAHSLRLQRTLAPTMALD
jgi:hypothetical protein